MMRSLRFESIGAKNFNPANAHKLDAHNIRVWPGFDARMIMKEKGALLNVDVAFRVVRSDSLLDYMNQLREKAEMPLRKLASLLDLDQSTLSKIERDERKPSVILIEQIAEVFNVEKSSLLVAFYSDVVAYEIQEESSFSEILQVAEAKIEYQRTNPKKVK
jgi:transcriptional regulator with XRE-family HTH domain